MEKETSGEPRKEGIYNITMEHKFILSSVIIIFLMFILKDILDKDFVMLFVLIAVLILFFSLFVELPRSRYAVLQLIGHLAWYIAIGSALFLGWTRWINTD